VLDEKVEHEINAQVYTGHGSTILPIIDYLFSLSRQKKEDIDLIAVGAGPGSFTGIRIGIATCTGLARALEVKLLGISSLDVLANGALPSVIDIMPLIDARKGEVFCARYSPEGKKLSDYMNIKPEQILSQIKQETLFIGDALDLLHDELAKNLGNCYKAGPKHLWYPRASVLGLMAANIPAEEFTTGVKPIYVRPSDATIALQKKLGKKNPPA